MKYKDVIIVCIVLALVSSCQPCKRLQRKCPPIIRDSIVETVIIKEDPNYTIPDSAYWQLEFFCDSNFNVLLRDYEEANSGVNAEVKIKEVVRYREDKTQIKALVVNISVLVDSIEVMNRTINKLKSEQRTIIKEVEVIKEVKVTPKYTLWTSYGFHILIILVIAYLYVSRKTKLLKRLI